MVIYSMGGRRWEKLPFSILIASLFSGVGMKVVKGLPVGCGPETCGDSNVSGGDAMI